MRHPRRRREREQVELEPPVLPHLLALAPLAHRRDEVPAPPGPRGDAVVRGQETRLLVAPVDLQQARRLEVVRGLGVVLADCVKRRHRRVDGAPEPSLRRHRPLHHAVKTRRIVVPRADEGVVRHHRVRRVDGVLEKRRPPVGHVSHLPVVAIRSAGRLPVLAHALNLRDDKGRGHARFELGLFTALPPRPHQPLRLHARPGERARSRVGPDAIFLLLGRRLGHVGALAVAVEPPGVVRAEQGAVVLDSPLG